MTNISIALTTFNGEKYLCAQLDSILNQTVQFDELVVCDDCSTDSTRDILLKYQLKDQRIKVYFNNYNIGFKQNFEKAIKLCKGDYIALADQDDIWAKDHLKILYENINNKMLACADAILMDSDGNEYKHTLSFINNYNKTSFNNNSTCRFILYYQNPFQGASMMLNRKFIDIALPIPEKVKYHDVWFALLGCILDSFVFINHSITYYRMHNKNASGLHNRHSTYRTLLGHLIKKEMNNNRKEVVDALTQMSLPYSDSSIILNESIEYYKDRKFKTRINNLLFELKNYSIIYGKQ